MKEGCVKENPASSVIISIFTTAAARIRLLSKMEEATRRPDVELLYTVSL